MMKPDSLYRYTFILILLAVSGTVFGQQYRKSRTENQSFRVGSDAELKIDNKYGSVQLIPWDKDSIKITVEIEVRAKKEAKATEILKEIIIDFVSFQSYVETTTSFTNQDSFWGSMGNKSRSMFSGDNRTKIEYQVYLPANTHLTVKNKYGDIFIDDHAGSANIEIANGDLRAGNLSGPTSINLEFAYANIKSLEVGNIKMDHKSELTLDKATELKIDSRSSRVIIKNTQTLKVNSNRDRYEIQEVGTIDMQSAYTYWEIGNLASGITAETRYGSISIDELGSSVKKLNFIVDNTDITLFKPDGRSISVQAIYSESAGLFFPSEMIDKNTVIENEEKKLVKTTGWIGEESNTPLELQITMPNGNLRIK